MTQVETHPEKNAETPAEGEATDDATALRPQSVETPARASVSPSVSSAETPSGAQTEDADSSAVADDAAYRVQLPEFEGPLDLLLHLIQQHELDILDIPIAFVTEKYVAYIGLMEDLNIDIASDYLVMAATLAHIKSRMLVPAAPDDEDDGVGDIEEDPRGELVRRLLEYQKYKNAASQLGGRSVLGRDVFLRGVSAPASEGPTPLAPMGVFRLLDAFQGVLSRAKVNLDHEIGVADRGTQVGPGRQTAQRLLAHLIAGVEL